MKSEVDGNDYENDSKTKKKLKSKLLFIFTSCIHIFCFAFANLLKCLLNQIDFVATLNIYLELQTTQTKLFLILNAHFSCL